MAARSYGTALSAHSEDGTGVSASSASSSGDIADAAVVASANQGGTGLAAMGLNQIWISSNRSSPHPPTSTASGKVGQLRWHGDAGDGGALEPETLWACVADGTPGTWRKLVGADTAGAFHLLPTPVRAYDSRPGTSPSQGPKQLLPAGNVARTIDLKHNSSGVPAGATGALVTVLLVNAASGAGNFTLWANDKPKPLSNTMVWGGSAGRFTTLAMTAVDAQARVKVAASLATNLVLDVVGYYR